MVETEDEEPASELLGSPGSPAFEHSHPTALCKRFCTDLQR